MSHPYGPGVVLTWSKCSVLTSTFLKTASEKPSELNHWVKYIW